MEMHDFEAFEYALHDHFDLLWGEFVFCLDLVVELSSLQQLDPHVNRVLGLVDFVELHQIPVVEFPHDLYLVYQGFFPELLAEGGLLRKGFHCILLAVFVLYDQVHGRKVSFPDFFDGFEKLVESPEVELAS